MINSFWNICSTCPMPKEEKLNSEYKRNFVWHPHYKPISQDVISVAPHSVTKDVMHRKKQYPELAYRNHEVIRHDLGQPSKDVPDSRARSEERDFNLASRAGPRSRSAEPKMSQQQQKLIMIQSFPPITSGRVAVLPKTDETVVAEHVSETSEYKSQFAWPKQANESLPCTARKSVSMGVIKGTEEADTTAVPKVKLAPVHRPCANQKNLQSEKPQQDPKKKAKTEYKSKYKPFTSYVYMDGQWKKTSRLLKIPEKPKPETNEEPWFVEVVERLQKANEYRWRGHGQPVYGEHLPDIYEQPVENPPQKIKGSPPNLQLHLPKVYENQKKGDVKKKDHLDASVERKRDKEMKPAPSLRRPKSAEPAKAKEQVKHKRPATTPPAKMTTAQGHPLRKPLNKEKDAKAKAPRQTSKKPQDETPKPGKKPPNSPQQQQAENTTAGGKVWLQAGQEISEHPSVDEAAPPGERTDAVRPSSLLPTPPPALTEETAKKTDIVDNNHHTDQEVIDATAKPITQPSVVPLTHVRTPEEVTGVKSPDPENWTVPIESSERLEWSGVNTASEMFPKCAKSPKEQISEKVSNIPASSETVPSTASEESTSATSSAKLTSANVLDRARSRLDQFWGKNK